MSCSTSAGTISVWYFTFYEFSPMAPTPIGDWEADQTAEFKKIFGTLGELRGDETTILKMTQDGKMMQVAAGIFAGNCTACHGKDGGGINGVNLTDNHYKNVKQLSDLYTVITNGAANGAMPRWEQRLSNNERVVVAAYASTLRGKFVPGRTAEGVEIPAWPKPTP